MWNKLHWLKTTERIRYRGAVSEYRCMNGLAPLYLSELLTPLSERSSRYSLRFTDDNRLTVPHVMLSTNSARAFTSAALRTWNSLPSNLQDLTLTLLEFCGSLKTFLFAFLDFGCRRDACVSALYKLF